MTARRLLLPQDSVCPSGFTLEAQDVHLKEYQLYAVEKWIVDRNRLSSLLIVYTGDPIHSIRLNAFRANNDSPTRLSLSADAAKPKHTPHGWLMVTSLAHFRSDYTIVLIPQGDFNIHRDPLYANINLLRIGCSGRSALTLEHPSDTTKERFISTYHLPDLSKDPSSFVSTVLHLIKLIQAGLAIFGLYSHPIDGLLCNDTVNGIRQWLAAIGGPLLHLQPTDRVLDPAFVSALLSLVLSTRNKLAYLGYSNIFPQDPFLYPHGFLHALASYTSSSSLAFLTLDLLVHISAAYDSKQKSDGKRVSRVIRNKLVPPLDSDGPDDRDRDIPDRPHPLSHPSSASLTTGPGAASSHGIGSSGGHILTGLATGIANPSVSSDASALLAPVLDLNFFVKFIIAGEDTIVSAGGAATRKEIKTRETKKGRSSSAKRREVKRLDTAEYFETLENDGPASISGVGASAKALWTGRVLDLQRIREREISGASSGPESLFGTVSHLAPFHFPKAGKRGEPRRGAISVPVPGPPPTSTVVVDALRGGVASDGDESWVARFDSGGVKGTQRYDGRSTEEESDVFQSHSYGGSGSGRAHAHGSFRWGGKLGSWAGLKKRKHQSVDLSATSSVNSSLQGPVSSFPINIKEKAKKKVKEIKEITPAVIIPPAVPPKPGKESSGFPSANANANLGVNKGSGSDHHPNRVKRPSRRSTVDVMFGGTAGAGASGRSTPVHRLGTRAQSPTLPPLGFLGELDVDMDDDDLLSSGQVSPLSDSYARPSLFHLGGSRQPSYNDDYHHHRQQPQEQYRNPSGSSSVQATSVNSLQTQPETQTRIQIEASQAPMDDKTHSLSRSTLTVIGQPSNLDLGAKESKKWASVVAELGLGRKPRDQGASGLGQARIASWADPVSAREGGWVEEVGGNADEDGDEGEGEWRRVAGAEGEGEESRAASPSHPVGSSRQDRGRGRWMKKRTGEDIEEEGNISELRDQLAAAASAGTRGTSVLNPNWRQKAKPRFHSRLSVVDGEGQLVEEEMEEESEGGEWDDDEPEEEEDIDEEEERRRRRRAALFDSKRRRSFHDLEAFRHLEVLSPTRMKIDVDLCGQCLIMWRREQHLKNVVAFVNHFSKSLSHTNTALRSHAESHLDAFGDLAERSKVLLEMDEESHRVERFSQATNALRYESAQFNVSDLWRAASAPRRSVWVLREKVFGLGSGVGVGKGGRKLVGAQGAQFPFNRSLWTLDGRREAVDYLGRTESEAAEERRIDPEGLLLGESLPEGEVMREGEEGEEEDAGDGVELPGIKPMWLLRFFTSWRARWTAATSHPNASGNGKDQGIPSVTKEDRESNKMVLTPLEVGSSVFPDASSASGSPPTMVSSPGELSES